MRKSEYNLSLVEGKMYLTEDGYVVLVKKNSLPEYKFSCVEAWKVENGSLIPTNSYQREVWKENGQAYHFDCYCSFVSEYIKEDK